MKRLRYWWFRHQNSYPHPEEIYDLIQLSSISQRRGRLLDVAAIYWITGSLEQTADDFNITRERVRQLLNKFYRESKCGS